MGGQTSKEESSDLQREVGTLERFIEQLKITLNVSALTENVSKFVQEKIAELQSFITSKIAELGFFAIGNGVQNLEEKLEQVGQEITAKTQEIQAQIQAEIEEEHKSIENEKLRKIREDLRELLRDYNTVSVSRKAWNDIVDLDVLHESTGLYVVASQPGYFHDKQCPAYMMIETISILVNAILEEKHRIKHLEKANLKFEEAFWEGVDVNSGEIKKNFLKLRRDLSAYTHDSYNERLGSICLNSEKSKNELPKDDVIPRNIYNAMKLIAIICSIPQKGPLFTDSEEQKLSVRKAKESIIYAISQHKKRYS